MWNGGGAVQSEHSRALPVHTFRPEPGQPQLRELGIHAGQRVDTHVIFTQSVLFYLWLEFFLFFHLFILLVCIHISLINFYLLIFSRFILVTCFTFPSVHSLIDASILRPHCCPILGLLLDSLGVWSAACLSVVMLQGCRPSQSQRPPVLVPQCSRGCGPNSLLKLDDVFLSNWYAVSGLDLAILLVIWYSICRNWHYGCTKKLCSTLWFWLGSFSSSLSSL